MPDFDVRTFRVADGGVQGIEIVPELMILFEGVTSRIESKTIDQHMPLQPCPRNLRRRMSSEIAIGRRFPLLT